MSAVSINEIIILRDMLQLSTEVTNTYNMDVEADYLQLSDMLCANDTSADCDQAQKIFEMEEKIRLLSEMMGNPCLSQNTDRTQCDKSFLHKSLLGYCFPFILALCLFGNGANVLTYSGRYLRKSTTVKMLTAKAILNTLFMICLIPHFFLLTFGNDGSNTMFEYCLWGSWPYMLFVANISGTSAIWLTVFMTIERYVFVAWPMHSKRWCTMKNFYRVLSGILLLAACLHVQIPVTRYVESLPCGSSENKFMHKMYVRNGTMFVIWESVYYWMNFIVALITPSVLLVVFTVKLTHKLVYCTLPNYSERKRCVTRITLATTACELALETPAVGIYAIAALYGPTFINENPIMCICHVITNFANQLNASICFFIYLLCSAKFRQLLVQRIKTFWCKGATITCNNATTYGKSRTSASRRLSEDLPINDNHFNLR